MTPTEILNEIAAQVTRCENCQLHFSRKNAVPGEGSATAEIMFIGEGPGFHENEQGRPFVGPAGKFLDELLENAGYKRSQVFIANVVKCRPPGNRDPLPEELAACGVYLNRQIETIDPRVIVTLGRISMGKFLPYARISEVHGKPFWVNERLIVAMYHPAAALHQPSLKTTIIDDFHRLREIIETARAADQKKTSATTEIHGEPDKPEEPPEQLSLF